MKLNKLYAEWIADNIPNNDYLILQGGKRAGKTFAILQYLFLQLVQEKKNAIICTDTYSRLRDSVLADWQQLQELPKLWVLKMSGTPSIQFRNGSQIDFVCAEKDTRGFSSNKDFIFFNEGIQYEYPTVRNLLKSGNDNCRVFVDYNPFTQFWANEKLENGRNKLITTYKDNPFCPKFAAKQLDEQAEIGKTAKQGTIERYIYEVECLGVDSTISGLVFPNSTSCTMAEYNTIIAPEVLAADWGSVDACADPDVVCGFKFTEEAIYCHEYFYSNISTDKDLQDAVLQQVTFKNQYFVYESQTSGAKRINNLYQNCGLKFRYIPCKKGSGSIMAGVRNLQPYQLRITDVSINFLKEQHSYKYVSKGDIIAPIDRYNHCFDTLRYQYNFYANNPRLMAWQEVIPLGRRHGKEECNTGYYDSN